MPNDTDERKRKQRGRSIAIALALGALVMVFYASTIINVGKALEAHRAQIERPKS